jgi:predicted metal-dependent hydrolase
VSHKADRIKQLLEPLAGARGELDAHYLAYFECFNRQLYYEAHEVLEELWLGERSGPNGLFYQGLIQLAGAFVHLQKQRFGPADALFRLAQNNLRLYLGVHQQLDVAHVLELINGWLRTLEKGRFSTALLSPEQAPVLRLQQAEARANCGHNA